MGWAKFNLLYSWGVKVQLSIKQNRIKRLNGSLSHPKCVKPLFPCFFFKRDENINLLCFFCFLVTLCSF